MATSSATRPVGSLIPADEALGEILKEIAVPLAVLREARARRDLVLEISERHNAARDGAGFASGSVAHGTENKPLEDADCGIKVNRRYEAFRVFGPDASEDRGPEAFIQMFAEFVLPRLRRRYPRAEVDLSGNRAIKFVFNETVDIDDWGPVDPYVDLIVGLDRADGPGIWIPNRRRRGWDAADPELHTEMMTKHGEDSQRVLRARLLRLVKRAVKRDDKIEGRIQVMCSWNLSALGLLLVDEVGPLGESLLGLLQNAAAEIGAGLTEDPAPAVETPIKLPDGVSCEMAARRLEEMAAIVQQALCADSKAGARAHLKELFGQELEAIQARERKQMIRGLKRTDSGAIATALGTKLAPKRTYSGGA